MARVHDFLSAALDAGADSRLQVTWNHGWLFENRIWQFLIFLPRWLLTEAGREEIFTIQDCDRLQALLERDFGGCTWGPSSLRGIGRRGAVLETNIHRQITVLASRWRGTRRYFRVLRRELEECTGEGRILMLRQELVLA
jgi:hypothetical protein